MSMKTETRISKYLARAGLASRRDAEKLLIGGRVSINGITTKNEFNGLFEFEQYVFPIQTHINHDEIRFETICYICSRLNLCVLCIVSYQRMLNFHAKPYP